ncbi:MAG: carboxy terminal-processing peptidase [Bacteroidota bacterium]
MKFRETAFLSVFTVAFLFIIWGAYFPHYENDVSSGAPEKESVLMRTILNISKQYHFDPEEVNDDYSEKIYDLYLERLDGAHRWLTQQDVELLMPYRTQLDDEATQGTYNFFDMSVKMRQAGIEKTQKYYQELLAEPFDFTVKEDITFDRENQPFAKDDTELREYWRKSLKYEVMTRLADKLKEQAESEEQEEEGEAPKTEAELEAEAREKVLEIYDKWYARLMKDRRSDYLSRYLNVFTNVLDPHTGYFEPRKKENFDINFKGQFEGIGARLQTDGDFTKVSDIIVGGPAWRGKMLKENDIITRVAQGDEKEYVDIKGMRVDDVVQHIRGKKGTKVRLVVKREDGTVEEVTIIRDVVIIEARFAKSAIIEGEVEGEKIGYIDLPGFYADFQDKNGRFSGDDIAAEIEKLKKDEVDGIILDLRGNPGGSLQEVVKMSGLFIENGPVVQVKSRDRRPELLSDTDTSVQYDGPLVVLVNSFSASASEILAAALQDYDRAIIVGSNSTFGKGTVQRFIDLDRMLRGNSEVKPLGQIKLTMQKYYRIDGGSVQLKGVVPDVILPDNFHYSETGERDYEHALDWSEITPATYQQNVFKIDDRAEIQRRSNARVAENETFQKVLQNAERLEARREQKDYPLNLDDYQAMKKARSEAAAKYKGIYDNEVLAAPVVATSIDAATFADATDKSQEERYNDMMESLKTDIYVDEALHIMHDIIELNEK